MEKEEMAETPLQQGKMCYSSPIVAQEDAMTTATTAYRDQVLAELGSLPDEYLPFVLQLVRTFRESITLKPAAASFHRGWHEAQQGDTYPITTLWDDAGVE